MTRIVSSTDKKPELLTFFCRVIRLRKAVPLKEAGTARTKGEEMGQPPLSYVF
jgi:hypothetical protein